VFAGNVGADGANIGIGHIVASLAKPDLFAHPADHFTELIHLVCILFQEMKHQSECGFLADTGQLGEFAYRILQ
jgi:hypothetical protein